MQPRTLSQLFDYLQGLGQRHRDVQTCVVVLAGSFPDLKVAQLPAIFIEADPLIEQVSEGADAYTLALHFLTREPRLDERRVRLLVSAMKELADEYGQQLLREGQASIHRQPTAVVLAEAGTDLNQGVRWEITLLLPKALDRAASAAKFLPLP